MANPRTGIIVCLGVLGGCFGVSIVMLQGWVPPELAPATPSPHASKSSLKREKRMIDISFSLPPETRRQIDSETIHRYNFDLTEGQFLDALVIQEDVDVTVQLREPRGEKLPTIDSRVGSEGPEEIRLFARTGGLHRIVIESERETGFYRLQVRDLRAATSRDEKEAQAEELFHHARALRDKKTPAADAQAFKEFLQAGKLWGELNKKSRQAEAIERAAEVWQQDAEKAAQTLNLRLQSLNLYQEVKDASGVFRQLSWIGKCHGLLGQTGREEEYYKKALRFAREQGNRLGEAASLANMGGLWRDRGERGKALDSYGASLALWRELGREKDEAETLMEVGLIYFSLGEFKKSFAFYKQARLLLSPSEKELSARIETRIAEALQKVGRWDEALAQARNALYLRRALGDRRGEGVVLSGMSLSYQGLKDFRRAREVQENALSIFRSLGLQKDATIASLNLGILFLRQGDAPQALVALKEVLADTQEQGLRDAEAVTLHAMAQASRRNPTQARLYAGQAIEIMESVRRDAVRDDLKAIYLDAQRGCYDLLVDVLVAHPPAATPPEHLARAFEVGDQRKARSLLDLLTSPRPAMSAEDFAIRLRLQKEIESYETKIERLKGQNLDVEALLQEQAELLERLRNLDARVLAQEKERLLPAQISLQKAQQMLDGRTILLVYHLGADRSFLWLVTPTSVEIHELPSESVIEAAAGDFHDHLKSSQSPSKEKRAIRAAKALGRILLGPVASRLGDNRLVIVPDGALHYVPFAALFENGSRLLEKNDTVSLPSVSFLSALREREIGREEPPGHLLVFAKSSFQEKRHRPLPNAKKEAEVIQKLVPPGERVLVKLEREATKEAAVSGLLSQFKTIHIATHGMIHPEHPELSGVVLTGVNGQGVEEDVYLRAHDIRALSIPADLVVLSACETALGTYMRAEGLVGLTQSFFHAGATSVLVSLWNVDDESTPAFMGVFYRSLYIDRRSPAEALRTAQLWMSRQPRWRSPYYWAGFVLQGEWR